MFAILGEAQSDADTLKVMVRNLAKDGSISIKAKGYDCCAELLRKAARDLKEFARQGYSRFIICYDADGPDPSNRLAKLKSLANEAGFVLVQPELEREWACASHSGLG